MDSFLSHLYIFSYIFKDLGKRDKSILQMLRADYVIGHLASYFTRRT